MYCKTITKGIFDSYIANDSDTILEGVVTNTFGNTTFWRFVRVPLAKGEHYVEALYAQSSFSFPLAMGVNHFSIKNGLEFMAFIVDHKETYCKSVEFTLLFDDYRQANSNWVTAEMREKFLAYIEKNYTPSAEVMKDKRFQSMTYDNAIKQYVYDRNNDTTSLDVMLKLLEKFDDSVVVDYLATPPDGKSGLPRLWNSLESGIRSPRSLPNLLWHIWFRPGNIRMRSARTLLAGKASARI